MEKSAILFVCLGNICRSPVAEGVFCQKINDAGLGDKVHIDSAGTAAWHVGKAPDGRMIEAAGARGYDISGLRARQAVSQDFYDYDFILAMDLENFSNLEGIRPADARAELALFLDYADGCDEREVPDPYFGGSEGFFHVIDLVERASDGLIARLDL